MYSIIIKWLLEHPPQWLIFYLKKFIKNPIKYIFFIIRITSYCCLIFLALNIKPILFKYKNKEFDNIQSFKIIKNNANLILNNLGHGTTITMATLGKKFYTNQWVSLTFNFVRACDEREVKFREGKGCDVDVSWRYLVFRKDHSIEKKTMNFFEANKIPFGVNDNRDFGDMVPVCINLYDKNGKLTKEGEVIKYLGPDFFKILKELQEAVNRLCFVQVKDPVYKNIVHLLTISLWGYKQRDIVDYKNIREYLRDLAKSAKQELLKDISY